MVVLALNQLQSPIVNLACSIRNESIIKSLTTNLFPFLSADRMMRETPRYNVHAVELLSNPVC